ncbi:hypothetical protein CHINAEXTREME_20560 (plasmid) [Halobiforma lacisalsi AJ5]|uniref:Uncharacterized protein n=1 Tax=Natronobacterium lacisalsi AJ5 TaxID=358396 RepID=M0LUY0_NATLA|nr:hypothetical protein [Halobiforma lacisalsi]APX00205.1 hypothetical protein CHINAEXTREME_20560 [Halobiforma lacisalsi AJ5]EMA37377.1 hypothetical protein C445_00771 [Halobiforma lacisalsi AJ5]
MSSNSDNTVALGARTNIFDSETGEFDLERSPKDETQPTHDEPEGDPEDDPDIPSIDEMLGRGDTHTQVQGVNRDAWVAGSILRSYGNPPLFCPECWYEYDAACELTEPEHHLPRVEVDFEYDPTSLESALEITKHDHRRHRHCPECGTISFGGVLGDRGREEFTEVVDFVLEAVDEVIPSRRRRLRENALERKAAGESDESNMEELVRELRTSEFDDSWG